MSAPPTLASRRGDDTLLRLAGWVAPAGEREDWSRFWQAELWYRRCGSNASKSKGSAHAAADLYAGLVRDALWLRTSSWERLFRRTAALCLVALSLGCAIATLLAVILYGGWQNFAWRLGLDYGYFLFAAPLVVFVTSQTAPRRSVHTEPNEQGSFRLYRVSFLAAKTFLLLGLTYLTAADLCAPLSFSFPNTAAFVQILLFVLLSVVGLRWTFQDQEKRCKVCLRLLDEPARVGRPSHNLLEWSGTSLACRKGHGLLSVPELETSWHQTSRWSRSLDPVN